jgi:hypothetical protein
MESQHERSNGHSAYKNFSAFSASSAVNDFDITLKKTRRST